MQEPNDIGEVVSGKPTFAEYQVSALVSRMACSEKLFPAFMKYVLKSSSVGNLRQKISEDYESGKLDETTADAFFRSSEYLTPVGIFSFSL